MLAHHCSTCFGGVQEYKQFQTDNPYDPSSSTIKNNVQWRDQHGNLLNIGRGGKIRKLGNTYYWIGHEPAPGPNLQVRITLT